MIYVRRASPLHAAAAAPAAAFCLALAVAGLFTLHPLVLVTLLLALVVAAFAAGVAREMGRAARFGVALGLCVALVNPFVSADGLTVIARLPQLPILVHDVTLEALAYGGVMGLRVVVVVCATALGALCVDPDRVLALMRPLSLRSALTAALATRMFAVLERDARRFGDAQRCRPDGGASRLAVVRAVAAGALDRAADVAATLEVRGYGSGRRGSQGRARPSRHDLAFGAAAAAILALVVGAKLAGVGSFEPYPVARMTLGPADVALCLALAVVILLPFADRRGIEP